jgi:hypothetical protein
MHQLSSALEERASQQEQLIAALEAKQSPDFRNPNSSAAIRVSSEAAQK